MGVGKAAVTLLVPQMPLHLLLSIHLCWQTGTGNANPDELPSPSLLARLGMLLYGKHRHPVSERQMGNGDTTQS